MALNYIVYENIYTVLPHERKSSHCINKGVLRQKVREGFFMKHNFDCQLKGTQSSPHREQRRVHAS